jgi:hypothetical protein
MTQHETRKLQEEFVVAAMIKKNTLEYDMRSVNEYGNVGGNDKENEVNPQHVGR